MTDNLFRQQAVDEQRHRLHGDILLLPKVSHTLISALLSLWVVVLCIWLFSSSYSRKETALGWLEPPNGVIRIYPKETGMIKAVLVKEGDHVVKDQSLLVLNDGKILASGDHLESKLLEEYETQHRLLTEQLTRNESIFKLQAKDINQRIYAAEKELQIMNQQITILSKRHELTKKQLERLKSLQSSGHISLSEYDSVVAQDLAIQSDEQNLIRSRVEAKNLMEQLQTELSKLPAQHNNEADQLRERLSVISQQIAQLNGESSYVLRAPKEGVVNNLQAIEGQLAQLGGSAPLMTLIPQDSMLTAHLLVPVRAAGFLASNQNINIRYDAFPYEKFGLYRAKIQNISRTILLPNELLNTPVQSQEPVYRITATLTEPNVRAYGKEFPLKPGMTLSADIELSKSSLIQWLVEPIYSLQGKL